MFIAVRLVSEIQPLEALDVFGMLKESSLKSLAEVLNDRKVRICHQLANDLHLTFRRRFCYVFVINYVLV